MKFGGSHALQVSYHVFIWVALPYIYIYIYIYILYVYILYKQKCAVVLRQVSDSKETSNVTKQTTIAAAVVSSCLLHGEQKEYERVRHGRKSAPALDIKRSVNEWVAAYVHITSHAIRINNIMSS